MELVINSYAKVNLYLEVLDKRRDNYHNIDTLFERIDLCDRITLAPLAGKIIKVVCDHPGLPTDNLNLAYRAAQLLQETFSVKKGVLIKIKKRIPIGSGLGGGSSNAASVLLGLNRLWRLNIAQKELAGLAGKIGADVPFFVYDVAFGRGKKRGDKIGPLKLLCGQNIRLWHILAVPRIHVSTPLIYKKWDLHSNLTRPLFDVKLLISVLREKEPFPIGKYLFNSLESVTEQLYPQVKGIKERLKGFGLESILMSGSGPAVFGIVSSRKEAVSLSKQLADKDRSLQVYVTRTI